MEERGNGKVNNDNSSLIFQQIFDGMKASSNLLHSLNSDVRETYAAVTGITYRMQSVEENVSHLKKIVTDGNGRDPLTTEVANLKNDIVALHGVINSLTAGLKEFEERRNQDELNKEKAKENRNKINLSGKWQLIILIATGLIAIATATSNIYFKNIFDKENSPAVTNVSPDHSHLTIPLEAAP